MAELMSAEVAAEYLGVKRTTLYAYVSRGLLDSVADPDDVRRRRYRRSDLDRLKRRRDAHSGRGAAAASALEWGAPSLRTALSRVTPAGPAYRGRPVGALVEDGVSYEAVAELLWTGDMPGGAPSWLEPLPVAVGGALTADARALDVLRLAVLLAGLEDPTRFAPSEPAQIDVARTLITRALVTLVAHRGKDPGGCGTVAELVGVAFGLRVTARVRRALNAALVVIADHELNASTFAARVAASTGADLYACVGAALATFTGPRHGGACDRCAALLAEVTAAGSARRALEGRVQRGEAPPGFGHPLYPDGDPRFSLLIRVAAEATDRSRPADAEALVAAAREMELGAPTCDMGLAILARALGLPAEAAATLFAVGRMAGWVAHVLEQRRQGFLVRPRARYIGEPVRGPAPGRTGYEAP